MTDPKRMSCDTFVVLPPNTANDCVIFGKNSDRPGGEVQEVVYVEARDYPPEAKLQCTYIEIPQVPHTHAVVLSKPAWMWGAEMGSNEHGVCIGNEAVWTKLNGPADSDEKLLGMDLLRLALERASSARDALDIIADLLTTYGQGGPCSDTMPSFTYHNSFLIVDRKEAWVMETAENLWAAQQITSGPKNISNCLVISTKIDAMSPNLKDVAQAKGYWKPDHSNEFDFAKVFGDQDGSDCFRLHKGKRLMTNLCDAGKFGIMDMCSILRDQESDICRSKNDDFPTAASQVSVLTPPGSTQPCCHWFTATPDPAKSVFKPFIFCPGVNMPAHTASPIIPDKEDPAKIIPRFKKTVDRRHNLYKLHEMAIMKDKESDDNELMDTLRELETRSIEETQKFLSKFTEKNYQEVRDLFKDVVDAEIKFYK
uniref:Secernin-2 n=1 Tax=Strigamia maritima TaxID=126957 RepID=T1IYU3_STRMM